MEDVCDVGSALPLGLALAEGDGFTDALGRALPLGLGDALTDGDGD